MAYFDNPDPKFSTIRHRTLWINKKKKKRGKNEKKKRGKREKKRQFCFASNIVRHSNRCLPFGVVTSCDVEIYFSSEYRSLKSIFHDEFSTFPLNLRASLECWETLKGETSSQSRFGKRDESYVDKPTRICNDESTRAWIHQRVRVYTIDLYRLNERYQKIRDIFLLLWLLEKFFKRADYTDSFLK